LKGLVPDLSSDDRMEVLVGAPGWDGESKGEGRVYLYVGAAAGLSAAYDWADHPADVKGAGFGSSLAAAMSTRGGTDRRDTICLDSRRRLPWSGNRSM
jgi:hypothetical protein